MSAKHLKKTVMIILLIAFSGCNQAVKTNKAAHKSVKKEEAAYSSFTKSNGLLFLSGQIGTGSVKGVKNSFDKETHLAIQRIVEILYINGLSTEDVISTTVYLTDIKYFEAFNKIYKQYFKSPFPTRTCVIVKELAQKANIEITVVASLE